MNAELASPNVGPLAARWWTLVIRGFAAILFGIIVFVAPGPSLMALVMFWGAYAIIDGVFNLAHAFQSARAGRRWGWLLFEGIVSIAAGVYAFAWPRITAMALLIVIAVWALLTGIAEIAAAIRLRRAIHGEWLLATGGILSILFGVLLLAAPGAGALALLWMIGLYAIVFGVILVALGLRLNHWWRSVGRPFPAGGTPTPA